MSVEDSNSKKWWIFHIENKELFFPISSLYYLLFIFQALKEITTGEVIFKDNFKDSELINKFKKTD